MQENNPFEVDTKRPKRPTKSDLEDTESKQGPEESKAVEKTSDEKPSSSKAGFFGKFKSKPKADNAPQAAAATPPANNAPPADIPAATPAALPPQPAPAPAASFEPAKPGDIINAINSAPNPIQSTPKSSFLGKLKPKKKSKVAIDGVSPEYNNSSTKTNGRIDLQQQQPVYEQPPQPVNNPAPAPENYVTPPPVYDQPYEMAPQPAPDANYQTAQQQPMIYQQPVNNYDNYPPSDMYTNPLLNNQPLPVNPYTAPNIYDPYNPNATMVDLNPTYPVAKKPDWRFVITLGAGIICLAGLIFFWIAWGNVSSSLSDTRLQMEDYKTKSETGIKAANQLEDLQNTIREQNTKIEDLQDEKDTLKKEADKVKDLDTQVTTLKKEKDELNTKLTELLLKQSNSSGSSSTD